MSTSRIAQEWNAPSSGNDGTGPTTVDVGHTVDNDLYSYVLD